MDVLIVGTNGLSIHLFKGILLGCQLRDSIWFISTFPVDSSTLGVADHHSRFVWVLILVLILVGNMTKPLFHCWLLNPPSWHVFIRPCGIHQTLK